MLMAGSSRIWKLWSQILLRVYARTYVWRGPAGTFLRLFTTNFELRVVDRSVFCHFSPIHAPPAPQSLSHNLRHHRSTSRRPARGACPIFRVLRDEHLYIDRPVCPFFAWPVRAVPNEEKKRHDSRHLSMTKYNDSWRSIPNENSWYGTFYDTFRDIFKF